MLKCEQYYDFHNAIANSPATLKSKPNFHLNTAKHSAPSKQSISLVTRATNKINDACAFIIQDCDCIQHEMMHSLLFDASNILYIDYVVNKLVGCLATCVTPNIL